MVLASRFLPVLRTVVPFAVGMSDFSYRRFLGWAAPASLLWSVIFIAVYSLATSSLRDGSASLSALFAALGVALYVVTVIAQRFVVRDRREQVADEA